MGYERRLHNLCRKEHYKTIHTKIKIPPQIEHEYKEKSYSVVVYGLTRTSLVEIKDRLPISKEFPQIRYRHKDAFFQSKVLYGEDPVRGRGAKEDPALVARDAQRLRVMRNLVRIVNKVSDEQQQQPNAGDPVPKTPQVDQ